jgi:hypothetical protein
LWFVFIVLSVGTGFLLLIPYSIYRAMRIRQFLIGRNSSHLIIVTVTKDFGEQKSTFIEPTTVKASGLRDVLLAYRVRLSARDMAGRRVRYQLFLPKKVKGIPNHKAQAREMYQALKGR